MCSDFASFKTGDRARLNWDFSGYPPGTIGRVLEALPNDEADDPTAPAVLIGLTHPAARLWITQEQIRLGLLELVIPEGNDQSAGQVGGL